jgi:hypothetical protein
MMVGGGSYCQSHSWSQSRRRIAKEGVKRVEKETRRERGMNEGGKEVKGKSIEK